MPARPDLSADDVRAGISHDGGNGGDPVTSGIDIVVGEADDLSLAVRQPRVSRVADALLLNEEVSNRDSSSSNEVLDFRPRTVAGVIVDDEQLPRQAVRSHLPLKGVHRDTQ